MRKRVLSVLISAVCLSSCGLSEHLGEGIGTGGWRKIYYCDEFSGEESSSEALSSSLPDPEELYDFCPDIPYAAQYYLSDFPKEYTDAYYRLYTGLFSHDTEIDIAPEVITGDNVTELMALLCKTYVWSGSMDPSYEYRCGDSGLIDLVKFSYSSDDDTDAEKFTELSRVAEDIASQASGLGSDYERICCFHDHLIENCDYSEEGEDAHSAYGALVEGRAVCEGYSKAFSLLCEAAGIPCLPVSGIANSRDSGTEAHQWNKVYLDGEWYNVDCTWDDPLGDGSGEVRTGHEYLLVSDEDISDTHTQDDCMFMKPPKAANSKGSWFYREGLVLTEDTDLYSLLDGFIADAKCGGSDTIEFICENEELYSHVKSVWIEHKEGEGSIATLLSKRTEPGETSYYSYTLAPDTLYVSITIE